jgi:hypothetical protein
VDDRPVGYFLLMPKACASLAAFRADPAAFDPSRCEPSCPEGVSDAMFALQTVSHESYHLLGFENEAAVLVGRVPRRRQARPAAGIARLAGLTTSGRRSRGPRRSRVRAE